MTPLESLRKLLRQGVDFAPLCEDVSETQNHCKGMPCYECFLDSDFENQSLIAEIDELLSLKRIITINGKKIPMPEESCQDLKKKLADD